MAILLYNITQAQTLKSFRAQNFRPRGTVTVTVKNQLRRKSRLRACQRLQIG